VKDLENIHFRLRYATEILRRYAPLDDKKKEKQLSSRTKRSGVKDLENIHFRLRYATEILRRYAPLDDR